MKHEQLNEDGKAFNGNYGAVIVAGAFSAILLGWAAFSLVAGIFEAAVK